MSSVGAIPATTSEYKVVSQAIERFTKAATTIQEDYLAGHYDLAVTGKPNAIIRYVFIGTDRYFTRAMNRDDTAQNRVGNFATGALLAPLALGASVGLTATVIGGCILGIVLEETRVFDPVYLHSRRGPRHLRTEITALEVQLKSAYERAERKGASAASSALLELSQQLDEAASLLRTKTVGDMKMKSPARGIEKYRDAFLDLASTPTAQPVWPYSAPPITKE